MDLPLTPIIGTSDASFLTKLDIFLFINTIKKLPPAGGKIFFLPPLLEVRKKSPLQLEVKKNSNVYICKTRKFEFFYLQLEDFLLSHLIVTLDYPGTVVHFNFRVDCG